MSIFASQTQATIALPFDVPQTITIRKLTGAEVERVQEAHAVGIATGGARTWAVRFRQMLEKGPTDPAVLKMLADPLLGYDRFAIIRAGLTGWSYPQSITPVAAKGTEPPVMVDAIADIDDEAADFIATEIMRLTKPALFFTSEEDAKADQKETQAAPSIA